MTQEEKAKAYDEALERLKGLIEGTRECRCAIVEEDIIDIFPELKESEGERIRKWIIDDIRYNMDNEALENSEYKKQGEKAIDWLEKQGDKDKLIKELGKYKAKYTQEVLSQQLEKQGEQKSKWTEEDEYYMGECISAIATKDGWSFEEKRKTKHWLNSIKQRIGE